MNWLRSRFSWRGLAIGMTAACGGLLMPTSAAGGAALLVMALFIGVLTHRWVKL